MASGAEPKLLSISDMRDSEELPPNISSPVPDGLPQTGPKGVLTDFYRMQQEERRKEMLEEKQRRELIERHTATVSREIKDRSNSAAIVNVAKALEEGALAQDPFLQEYRAKRLDEIKQQAKLGAQRVLFGNLVEIRGDHYASAIDSAPPKTFVVLHIYDELLQHCQLMNKCLAKLAKVYPTVKFCRVQSHQVGVSLEFVQNALPAILVYKGGEMKGNHLRVTDALGQEFTMEDLEGFLQEHNCLPPESERTDILSPDPCEKRNLRSRRKTPGSDSD